VVIIGAGLSKSQRRYYERKALINLQKKVGGTLKGNQLHFKKGWVSPDWMVASNAEMALNLKAVKRDRFRTLFGKRVKGKATTGQVYSKLSDSYWNRDAFATQIKKIKR
jgi:hypothetical protein